MGLLSMMLAACYAPAHFHECSLRCAADTMDCPDGTTCGTDGYCHQPGAASCDGAPSFAGLTGAEALDETSVRLSWDSASDDLTVAEKITYRVYQATTAGGEDFSMPTFVSVPGASSIQLAGLSAKTTYYFVVRAVDDAGHEDENTHELSVTTLDLTPPVFAGVESLTASGSTIAVSFSAATDNVDAPAQISYRVYLADTPGAEDYAHPTATTQPGVTGAILSMLASAPAYYVVVRAVDSSGNEDANTVERSVSFGDTMPPSFLGANGATGLTNAVKLTYSPASDTGTAMGAIVYLAYQAGAAGQEDYGTPTVVSAPGATSISVGKLTESTQYFFVVRARDEAGNIDTNTVEVSATTLAGNDTTPPSFGGLTSATSVGSGSIQLGWTAASDAVSASGDIVYAIYQADLPGHENFTTPSYVTQPGATSFTVVGLQAAKSYSFVVRAQDQAGNMDTNPIEKTATTDADNTPPAFAGVVSANAISSTAVSLSWAAASDDSTPTDQIVYLGYASKTFGGQSFGTPGVVSMPGVSSAQLGGLAPSTAYFFVVRARDQAGNVDVNTVQVMATTLADTVRPMFAGATSATATSNTTIQLAWAAGSDDVTPPGQLVYDVYQATSAGAESYAAPSYTSPPGATGMTVSGLTPLVTYYFVVRARDAAGNRDQNTKEVSATEPPL